MSRRVSTVGLCMLCALSFSALAAEGARAVTKGTTAFTCKKKAVEGGAGFSAEHCKTTDAVGSGAKYEHLALEAGKKIYISASNERTNGETTGSTELALKATIAGVAVEIKATGALAEGTAENAKTEAGEHILSWTGMLRLTGVTVAKPAGKGCKAYTDLEGEKGVEGVVDAHHLTATTAGQGDFVKFQPTEGELLATLRIEGCSIMGLNGIYELKGTMKAVPNGATLNFGHAEVTAQETLKLKGANAGLEGSLTISGSEALPYSAVSLTTSGAYEGTTAFPCKKKAVEGGAGFSKAHCRSADAVETGAKYVHGTLATGTGSPVKVTNENTGNETIESAVTKLKATIAGTVTELQATGVQGEGTLANTVSGTEHYAFGTGSLVYTGVTVAQPAGKGCKAYEENGGVKGTEGRVVTQSLTTTTKEQGDFVKVSPTSGEVLAKFIIEGCSVEALNGNYEVKGSVKGVPDGGTINFTHEATTTPETLKLNGVKAGIEGSLTPSVLTLPESGQNPLSVTTVETP